MVLRGPPQTLATSSRDQKKRLDSHTAIEMAHMVAAVNEGIQALRM